MKPVSVVIPVVEHHDQFLPELISSLIFDNEVLQEIIVARSGLHKKDWINYEMWLKDIAKTVDLTSEITLSAIDGKAREAPNRNRGWLLVKSPYTAFLDADDTYSAGRLTLLEKIASHENASLLLHDYCLNGEELPDARSVNVDLLLSELVPSKTIRKATFGNEDFPYPWDYSVARESTSLKIPEKISELKIHHAHIFVSTEVRGRVIFRDVFPGSDGLFCQETLAEQENVFIVPLKLSSWMNQRSAYANSRTIYSRVSSRSRAYLKRFVNLWNSS